MTRGIISTRTTCYDNTFPMKCLPFSICFTTRQSATFSCSAVSLRVVAKSKEKSLSSISVTVNVRLGSAVFTVPYQPIRKKRQRPVPSEIRMSEATTPTLLRLTATVAEQFVILRNMRICLNAEWSPRKQETSRPQTLSNWYVTQPMVPCSTNTTTYLTPRWDDLCASQVSFDCSNWLTT